MITTINEFKNYILEENVNIDSIYGISKDNKEIAKTLLNTYTTAKNKKITGLKLTSEFNKKLKDKDLPNGFDLGVDKDGWFIHTHRARSKSYNSPLDIPIKDIKFIDSTG